MAEVNNIRGLFQNRTYARLFTAQLASQIGSVTGLTALAFFMLNKFSSQPFYATITEMMYSLPTLTVFFLTGVLADRFDRQKIMVNCDIICMLLSVFLLGAIFLGWMPLVYTFLFLRSAVTKIFHPANAALVRGVLTPEQIPSAMGLNQMLMSAFILLGTSLGAYSYWRLGILGSVVIDALSFGISAFLIASCKIPVEARLPNGFSTWRSLKGGTRFYARSSICEEHSDCACPFSWHSDSRCCKWRGKCDASVRNEIQIGSQQL